MTISTTSAGAPVARESTLIGHPEPFCRLLQFDRTRAGDHPECIEQLRAGQLTTIIVRQVYDSEFMTHVTNRLERHDPPFLKTSFPEKFRSWFYGRNLNLMGTDPQSYFAQAAEFHIQMRDLFPGDRGISECVMPLLSRLDGGRPYRAAPGPEPGQEYMLTTFRGHAQGGYIPAHCDNEQSVRPAYEHLRTLVSDHMYSMVLMIGAPDSGGALEVFDHRIEVSAREAEVTGNTGALAGKIDLSGLPSAKLHLRAGEMVILDSGRYLHRVTPVQGATTRWVACSFMAHSLERNAVYCWG
ncbi:MAG: 2OG-Fe(II) oxygenase [Fuerstiella sp.]